MLKITKAKVSENIDDEWDLLDDVHYGGRVIWVEKPFKFKAVESGKVIGTIEGKFESGVVYIEAIITAKSARGKGVGTKLIQKAEDFGRKQNAHRIWLLTGRDWPERRFYKKLGFKMIGEIKDFYFHKDFVIYTREIY